MYTSAAISTHISAAPLITIIRDYLCPHDVDDYTAALLGYGEQCANGTRINEIYCGICEGGHADMLDMITTRRGGHSPNIGMRAACLGGQLSIAKLMITLGAAYFNDGLFAACEGGHAELVELMLSHGARNKNKAMKIACEYGHLPVVNLMIDRGANNWNECVDKACEGGYIPAIELMLLMGGYVMPLSASLYAACFNNHLDAADILIKHGANPNDCRNCWGKRHRQN